MPRRGVKRLTAEDVALIEARKRIWRGECRSAKTRDRYHDDPEFRKAWDARNSAYCKKRRAEDPEFRKKLSQASYAYTKRRRARDPEFVEQRREYLRKYQRDRYHTDPEYREKRKAARRARYRRQKEMKGNEKKTTD